MFSFPKSLLKENFAPSLTYNLKRVLLAALCAFKADAQMFM